MNILKNTIHLQHTVNTRVKREVIEAYQLLKYLKRSESFVKSFNPHGRFLVNVDGDISSDNIPNVFNV